MSIRGSRTEWKLATFVTLSLLLANIGVVRGQVSTTFDADLEGWMITGDNAFTWQATGGNPGGNLDVNDLATGAHNYAAAPLAYLGDWSAFTSNDSLFYDVYVLNTSGGSHSTGIYVFRIAGPGGSAWAIDAIVNYPPLGVWTTFKTSLNPTDWTVEAGTWADILANVTSLRANAEFVYGDEEVYIDNIGLTSSPQRVVVECAQSDFNTPGTGDWTFQGTSGATNPGAGGNGGGYVQIKDSSTTVSHAYTPSIFLGDWTPLNGSGILTIDFRVISRSGSERDLSDFISIMGPGGSAHIGFDPSELPESDRIWKTFVFPVDASAWTVDSGTWTGLLADVTSCRITMEFFDQTETVGFDNFGRLAASCPPIDDTVQIHDPALTDCGYDSFVGIGTVAANPRDWVLYGTVRATTGSGGGLYSVDGPNRAIRIQAYDRPAHLIFDEDGDAYVSEDYDGGVFRLEWGGASSLWVSGFHSGDDDPFGMTIAPPGFNGPTVTEGDFLVTDRGNSGADQIWSFSPDVAEGEQLVMPDPGDTDHLDLTAAPSGVVYVCDRNDSANLFVLDPMGILTPFPLSMSIPMIQSIVYDEVENEIYIASGDTKSVYRVDPGTGQVTLVADGFSGFHPCCLELDSTRRRLWVADNGYNRVYDFCLSGATAVSDNPADLGNALTLEVVPNPFNPMTKIFFRLDHTSWVRLDVYDLAGRLVDRLVAEALEPGPHSVTWDGRDERGEPVASGTYFLRLDANADVATTKLLLLK